jgi:hypothetical protein
MMLVTGSDPSVDTDLTSSRMAFSQAGSNAPAQLPTLDASLASRVNADHSFTPFGAAQRTSAQRALVGRPSDEVSPYWPAPVPNVKIPAGLYPAGASLPQFLSWQDSRLRSPDSALTSEVAKRSKAD